MSIIGIDFGTDLNKIGCFNQYGLKIIINNYKNPSTPSVAYLLHKNRWFFGERAVKLGTNNPKQFIYETKLMLGKKFNDPIIQERRQVWQFSIKEDNEYFKIVIEVDGENLEFYPYEIAGLILKNLVDIANSNLNLPAKTNNVIISVPVDFNDEQKKDLMKAAKLADLQVIRLITEPISAFFSYIRNIQDYRNKYFLLYDIGYSAINASIIKISNKTYDIITEHDNTTNGIQLKDSLFKQIIKKFESEYPKKLDFLKNPKIKSKLLSSCEEAKIILSEVNETEITIDDEDDEDDDQLIITLSEEEFNKMNSSFFNEAMKPVINVMKKANIDKNLIDSVFLIGGSTYMKKIREKLKEITGIDPCPSADPREAVALGACVAGSKLPVDDFLLSGQEKWGQMIGSDILQNKISFLDDLEIFGKFLNPIGISFGSKEEIIIQEGTQIPCVIEREYQIEEQCNSITIFEKDKDKNKPLHEIELQKPISESVGLLIETTLDEESLEVQFRIKIRSKEYRFKSSKPCMARLYKDSKRKDKSTSQNEPISKSKTTGGGTEENDASANANDKPISSDKSKIASKTSDAVTEKDEKNSPRQFNNKSISNDKIKIASKTSDAVTEKDEKNSSGRFNDKSISSNKSKTNDAVFTKDEKNSPRQFNDKSISSDKSKIANKPSNSVTEKDKGKNESKLKPNDKVKTNGSAITKYGKTSNTGKSMSPSKPNAGATVKKRIESTSKANNNVASKEEAKMQSKANDGTTSVVKIKVPIKRKSKSPSKSNDKAIGEDKGMSPRKPNNESTSIKSKSISTNKPNNESTSIKGKSISTSKPNNESTSIKSKSISTNKPNNESTSIKDKSISTSKPNNESTSIKSKSISTSKPNNESTSIKGKSISTNKPNNESTSIKSKSISTSKPNNESTSIKGKSISTSKPNNESTSIKSKSISTSKPNNESTSIKGKSISPRKANNESTSIKGKSISTSKPNVDATVKKRSKSASKANNNVASKEEAKMQNKANDGTTSVVKIKVPIKRKLKSPSKSNYKAIGEDKSMSQSKPYNESTSIDKSKSPSKRHDKAMSPTPAKSTKPNAKYGNKKLIKDKQETSSNKNVNRSKLSGSKDGVSNGESANNKHKTVKHSNVDIKDKEINESKSNANKKVENNDIVGSCYLHFLLLIGVIIIAFLMFL